SIYVHVKRSLLLPILEGFDAPEPDRPAAARFASTQPTQALGLLNSAFVQQQAAALAARLRREAGGDAGAQVALALRLAAQRPPRDVEVRRGRELVAALARGGAGEEDAVKYFCLMVLNLNEFVYLD